MALRVRSQPVKRILTRTSGYLGDVCSGDTLTYRTRISDIYDKKDGALEFIVTDTDVDNQDGDCVVKMHRVYVIRN